MYLGEKGRWKTDVKMEAEEAKKKHSERLASLPKSN